MQRTFSELEYAGNKKLTRRDRFLADLEQLVPWALLKAQVAPFYAATAGSGRPATRVLWIALVNLPPSTIQRHP